MVDSSKAADKLTVLVPVSRWFLRPKNTDWHYAARSLPGALSQHCPDVRIALQQNTYVDLLTNVRMGLAIARGRAGMGFIPLDWTYALEEDCPVQKSDISDSQAQAIFAYERFPSRTFGLPVAWITSPSYPEVMQKQGYSSGAIQRAFEWKRSRAEHPGRLIFNTQVALDNFMLQNGEQFRSKSVVIHCLIPDLIALKDAGHKWEQGPLKFLFVGRQAKRKGLPATVEAMTPLLKAHPDITFTIVSSMDDGPVEVPSLPNIVVTQDISRSALMQMMAESHFLLMPSWFENYGFVYIEAMSQGCLPLALNNPIQRELIGDYGILISAQDADEMRQSIGKAIESRDVYKQKAIDGLQNFKNKHTPKSIALQFQSAFEEAVRI